MKDRSAGAAALAVEFAIASVKPVIKLMVKTVADCRMRMALVVREALSCYQFKGFQINPCWARLPTNGMADSRANRNS